ncbi:MAG TPA: imidazoleglycerol-phosphate dehydratase HisB [Beijerinckiaceae bacterium]|nr:imidazoleglycerol-phosphate dehydratase HisB [Beijerinckiaceae bacterium]
MRRAAITRKTNETEVAVTLDVDGSGRANIATGVGFFDHMLEQVARHSLIDLDVAAKGDLHVDMHHCVEDVGIALGRAIREAAGDLRGVTRFADVHQPMDETLTRVALDMSGRAFLVFDVNFRSSRIGDFDTQLVREFFQAFAANAGVTLHVAALYGQNDHHIAESCFKGLARALRQALAIDPRRAGETPSTKGSLG